MIVNHIPDYSNMLMSRISSIPVFIVLVCFLAHSANGGEPFFQGPREFFNPCDGCVVSKGIGYQTFFFDCTCFYTCVLVRSQKLSSMASPYVAYKKCCNCDESFSKKLLTCVKWHDKRSECFDTEPELPLNACLNLEDGDRLPREKADSVRGPLSKFCSGFVECKNVSGIVVPRPQCCPGDHCYDDDSETCTEAACHNSAPCEALREGEEDDCECETTEAPESECPYMPMENSVTKFMHIQEMYTYTCPPATCWDQELCTCVQVNNTGYNDCEEWVDMDFETDLSARDSRGAIMYTAVHGNVTRTMGQAAFQSGDSGQLNVMATSNAWLSNDLVLHFKFILENDNEDSNNEDQCFVGNCKILEQSTPADNDTMAVTMQRSEGGAGEEINVHVEYQDRVFMNLVNSMENLDLEVEGFFQTDTMYDFGFIYCGSDEVVYAGVLLEGEAIAANEAEVEGSIQIIDSQTGFVFGTCERGEDFEGRLDEVEIYKNCKPVDDEDYENALEEILDQMNAGEG